MENVLSKLSHAKVHQQQRLKPLDQDFSCFDAFSDQLVPNFLHFFIVHHFSSFFSFSSSFHFLLHPVFVIFRSVILHRALRFPRRHIFLAFATFFHKRYFAPLLPVPHEPRPSCFQPFFQDPALSHPTRTRFSFAIFHRFSSLFLFLCWDSLNFFCGPSSAWQPYS